MAVVVINENTLKYTYGESITTMAFPLPLKHRYTKSQQAMVDAVTKLGWSLDPTAVLNTYGYSIDRLDDENRRRSYLQQHPFIFVREDADGGWWQLELDYASRDYSHYGNRGFNKALLGAKLRRFTASADEVTFDTAICAYSTQARGRIMLEKQSNAGWANYNYVTGAASDGGRDTLREQVLALATDPGLVLWVAAERKFHADEAKYAARRAQEREEAARRRPLPAGWDELKVAARAVAKADGMTDLVAVKAALEAALAAVEDEVVVR